MEHAWEFARMRYGEGSQQADQWVHQIGMDLSATQTADTSNEGRFRFPQLPVGPYEVIVEAAGFGKYRQGPIVLRLNEQADLTVKPHLYTPSFIIVPQRNGRISA